MRQNNRQSLRRFSRIALAITFGCSASVLLSANLAFAGTDTTFNSAVTALAGYINGSAGKLAALVALGYGLSRMATTGWSLGSVGVPIAVGLAAGVGGPIVQASVTALI